MVARKQRTAVVLDTNVFVRSFKSRTQASPNKQVVRLWLILEEIWKVRDELIKKHGGLDGYFKYVQKLDTARRRKPKRKSSQKQTRSLARRS